MRTQVVRTQIVHLSKGGAEREVDVVLTLYVSQPMSCSLPWLLQGAFVLQSWISLDLSCFGTRHSVTRFTIALVAQVERVVLRCSNHRICFHCPVGLNLRPLVHLGNPFFQLL